MPKRMPDKPRRDLVKKAARAFLLSSNQDSLPIDIDALYESDKYLIFDAERAEDLAGIGIPIDFWNNETADAFTCFYKGFYVTIYKSRGRTPQRIRFSKAHELGHIILGHFTEFEQLDSYSIHRSKIYRILEREADMFAAELLAPTPVLKKLDMFDAEKIQCICDISKSAADITISDMNMDINVSEADKNAVLRRFHRYIFTNEYSKRLKELVCPRCGAIVKEKDHYCEICGKRLTSRLFGSPRYYSSARVTQNGRLIKCLKCGNEKFRGGSLQCICGQPLYNKCIDPEHKKLLPEFARYCPICGGETSFSRSRILTRWTDDIIQRKKEQQYFEEFIEDLPVSTDWHYWVHEKLVFDDIDLYTELKDTRAILDEDDLVIFGEVDKVPVDFIRESLKKYCDLDLISVTVEKGG